MNESLDDPPDQPPHSRHLSHHNGEEQPPAGARSPRGTVPRFTTGLVCLLAAVVGLFWAVNGFPVSTTHVNKPAHMAAPSTNTTDYVWPSLDPAEFGSPTATATPPPSDTPPSDTPPSPNTTTPNPPTAAATDPAPKPPPTPVGPFVPMLMEADSATLAGGAKAGSCARCSSGTKVRFIGANAGAVSFNGISAPAAMAVRLTFWYVAATIPRTFYISVDGAAPVTITPASTVDWSTPSSATITVQLGSGANSIEFFNPTVDWAPDLDRIALQAT